MSGSKKFLEIANIASAFVPVDMQTGANDGDWVNLKDYERVVLLLFKGIGTAGDDPIFTVKQASDNAGTGAKALNFTTIREKVGATALSAVAQWTTVEQTAASTYTNAASAENEALIAVEIRSSDLDLVNDFTHIQLSIPDVGANAQIGGAVYIFFSCRYPQENPPSVIG